MTLLFRPAVLKYHWKEYSLIPPTTDPFVAPLLQPYGILALDWGKIDFFRSTIPAKKINQIWLDLKSH